MPAQHARQIHSALLGEGGGGEGGGEGEGGGGKGEGGGGEGGGEGEDDAVARNTGSHCGGQVKPRTEGSAFELGWPMAYV